ncbi:MAG: GUN4 domain-containing protein, partial [Pelagibacteraceae bacterium]
MGDYQSAVSAYKNFYSAFKEGKFDFHPIVGGLSQAVQGDDLLQTVFLTSINYLSPQQKRLANQAFQEAINANDQVTSQDKYLKRSEFLSNQAYSKLELNSSLKKQPISTSSIEKRKILLSNIENYLKHQEWRKADAETAKFLQSFLGNHFWGLRIKLQLNDIYCIPQEELDFINKLWLNYSNGNYGFSVQKKIWQVMECPEYPDKQWGAFLKRLGWGWRWMMKTS